MEQVIGKLKHASGVPMILLCVESDISPIPLQVLQEGSKIAKFGLNFRPSFETEQRI